MAALGPVPRRRRAGGDGTRGPRIGRAAPVPARRGGGTRRPRVVGAAPGIGGRRLVGVGCGPRIAGCRRPRVGRRGTRSRARARHRRPERPTGRPGRRRVGIEVHGSAGGSSGGIEVHGSAGGRVRPAPTRRPRRVGRAREAVPRRHGRATPVPGPRAGARTRRGHRDGRPPRAAARRPWSARSVGIDSMPVSGRPGSSASALGGPRARRRPTRRRRLRRRPGRAQPDPRDSSPDRSPPVEPAGDPHPRAGRTAAGPARSSATSRTERRRAPPSPRAAPRPGPAGPCAVEQLGDPGDAGRAPGDHDGPQVGRDQPGVVDRRQHEVDRLDERGLDRCARTRRG